MTKTGLVNNNPKHELTESDARKGGINSGKVRAAKKSLREKAQLLMSLSIQDKDELIKATELGLDAKDVTWRERRRSARSGCATSGSASLLWGCQRASSASP